MAQIVAQMTAASSMCIDKRPKSRAFVYTHTTGYGLGGFNYPAKFRRPLRRQLASVEQPESAGKSGCGKNLDDSNRFLVFISLKAPFTTNQFSSTSAISTLFASAKAKWLLK
ncbi:TPA: hypothetical protein ACU8BS_000938 [Neisseria subflava]